MRNKQRNTIRIEGLTFDETSSLNQFFMCECARKFQNKSVLIRHLSKCNGKEVTHSCRWCSLTFKNRGNLVVHAKHIHGDDSYRVNQQKNFECNVCDAKYDSLWKLKYHIRRTHYNLFATTPRCQTNPINQVWFEKVLNSPKLVEIKKTGPNTLVMKSMAPNTKVEISDHNQPETIDLHSVYPTGCRKTDAKCKICKKFYKGRDLKKHVQEAHQTDFVKHKCNNCNMLFKRSYIYLKHVCNKVNTRNGKRKLKGVKQFGRGSIAITNVTSLCPVEID